MIVILLSTYNGEKYLKEQLDSIFCQTYQEFELIIRDDGSSDSTLNIINEYQEKQPDKIQLLKDNLGNVGVAKSFKILMEQTESDYYLFADQDDIWESNKIEILLNLAENSNYKNEPYLLFSNMIVFHQNTGTQHVFFKSLKIDANRMNNGLFFGTITGCLMLFNDKAKQASLRLNSNSNMLHDWDILMTCFLFGKIELSNERLIKHRIHDSNVMGENLKKDKLILAKDLVKYIFNSSAYREIVLSYYFKYVDLSLKNVNIKTRLEKELFNEIELKSLSYFQRKKWYLKHFNPFVYGRIEGTLMLLTI